MVEHDGTDVFVISGSQTLPTIAATHAALLERLADAGAISVDCSTVADIDLSFVQLLVAAQHHARAAGKPVRLAHAPDGPLLATLQRGGFLASSGQVPADQQAFWRLDGCAA